MPGYAIMAAVIWIAALGIWWVVSRAFRHADVDKIKSRLTGGGRIKLDKAEAKRPALIRREDVSTGRIVLRLLTRYRLTDRLREMLEQAGLQWNVARLIHGCLAVFLAVFAAAWAGLPGDLRSFAVFPAGAAAFLPIAYVARRRTHRLRKFEEQFPESLEFVARSMRAGHAFTVSLEMIHREFQEPLAGEYRRTFEEHNLGLPLEMALLKFAKRVPLLDVHFFVSAVLLQKRTGGNLAEILDKLAYVIRERFKLRGKIRAISAHGRMTGTALTMIPIGVGGMLFWVNPDYVRFFFTDPTGQIMIGAAVLLQMIGYAVIRKIVSIEV
ncbi:MAG: type II secretion system F family protein [Acidobacteria bacterium]|jgi:tight adherence protein B|nr:type II secretion system F family protein [Acidobacteriota bacterium]